MINVLPVNSGGDNLGLIERIVHLDSDTQVQSSSLPLTIESTLLLTNLPELQFYSPQNEKAMTSACSSPEKKYIHAWLKIEATIS